MKLIRYIFIFVFLAAIYFPLTNNKYHFIRKTFDGLIPVAPRPDLKKLDNYPRQYEDYFDKRLEVKPWLVAQNSKLKIKGLGVSPIPDKVIIGNDGWLYLTERCLPEVQGTNLFTDDQLQLIKKKFDERASHAKEKFNSKLYFTIVPLKHTIYQEYLPGTVHVTKGDTRTDQLIRLFRNDTLVKVIDVRDALKENKSSHILYYKTDNHWNDIGGWIAYRKMIDEVGKDFQSVHPVDIHSFEMDSSIQLTGGEASMLNAVDLFPVYQRYEYNPGPACRAKTGIKRGYQGPEGFPYPWDYELVRETGDSLLPDALVIRDSFSDALLPFLAENFRRSVFIFDAWQYKSLYDIVDIEKPQVVMYIVLESNFDSLLKFD